MFEDLKGKNAIVTGAGKRTGIGYGIASKLAAQGCNVVIADLGISDRGDNGVKTGSMEEMQSIADELGSEHNVKALAVAVDVTDNNVIGDMIETIKGTFDSIEILCNNAGATFGVPNAFHCYDEALWMKTIDVNLHSVFKVTRAVLPLMMGKQGSIINTSSRAGKVPPVANGAYAVAKAGVNMLTKVMARELGGVGIRVNAICPGQIGTDLEKWRFGLEAKIFSCSVEEREEEMCKTIPLCRIGSIEEVAALVIFLASDESSYITGQAINVTGGQLMEL
jgi:NAD(P)-dependent dehydrogenase (short-subunit alcohol dehydrogenase family)